jgi:hypothetical protein
MIGKGESCFWQNYAGNGKGLPPEKLHDVLNYGRRPGLKARKQTFPPQIQPNRKANIIFTTFAAWFF